MKDQCRYISVYHIIEVTRNNTTVSFVRIRLRKRVAHLHLVLSSVSDEYFDSSKNLEIFISIYVNYLHIIAR